MVGHAEQADLVGQQMPVRIDGDVADIGEHAGDEIGAAAPRHLQPFGDRLGDPCAFDDDVAAAPLVRSRTAWTRSACVVPFRLITCVGAEILRQLKPEIGAVDRDDGPCADHAAL